MVNIKSYVQTGDMKCRPGNGIEGAMVCTSLGSLLRPLFYFLDDVSYPQSVQGGWGGWPTGNGKKLSSCQAQLGQATCLAVA